jgi:hypothetical protein
VQFPISLMNNSREPVIIRESDRIAFIAERPIRRSDVDSDWDSRSRRRATDSSIRCRFRSGLAEPSPSDRFVDPMPIPIRTRGVVAERPIRRSDLDSDRDSRSHRRAIDPSIRRSFRLELADSDRLRFLIDRSHADLQDWALSVICSFWVR